MKNKEKNQEIEYTHQQEEAINTKDCNILVSAAAGSGKTMILVDRIIRIMVEKQVDIDSFLIVTFTNAAANEMMEKIRKKLLKELGKGNSKFIRRQLQNINNANISTMHSFCIKILREYYEFIGLSPNFKIANNSSSAVIQNHALDLTLEKEYADGSEDFIDFFDSYANRREENLAKLINNIHYNIQAQIDPISWLETKTESVSLDLNSIISYVEQVLIQCKALIENSLVIARGPGGPYKYIDSLESDLSMIKNLYDLCSIDKYDDLIAGIRSIYHPTIGYIRSKKDKEATDPSLQNLVKSYRQESKDKLEGLRDDLGQKTLKQIEYENHLALKYLNTLARLVVEYDKNLKEIKEEENILEISDLEHLCLSLLDIEEIQEKVSSKIDYIFYDEYQDINPIQEAIINKIKRKDNLFFVGDIKQSIYRFRLADPSLFNKRLDEYANSEEDKLINLTYNFRSSPHILNFLNVIFENIMSPKLGGVVYDSSQKLLVPEDKIASEDKGEVKIILNEKASELAYNDLTENAKYIAEEILSLVKAGYDYKDIVILMRNVKNRIEDYEDALNYYGIPYYSDTSNISLENPEVSIVIDLLKVINNYRNDESLISVLLTPIGKMTEDDLAEIKIHSDQESFYDSMLAYYQNDEVINDRVKKKIHEFIYRINSYREDLFKMKLSEFTYFILSDSGYLSYIAAGYNGGEKTQNILAFIERIKDYEEATFCTLTNFLKYVDTLLGSPKESLEPTKLLSDQDNLVRIMTIHKSKGLQFPIVFMTDMQSSTDLVEKRDDFVVDDKLGIGLRIRDKNRKTSYKTLHRKTIDNKKEEETLSEEVRLFYVGTTRAIEKLYLVGFYKNCNQYLNKLANKTIDLAISGSKSMMDWYMSVLVHDKTFIEKINQEISGDNEIDRAAEINGFSNPEAYSFIINQYKKVSKEVAPSKNIESILVKEDFEQFKEYENIFQFKYPNKEKTTTPFKTTVSELSAKNRYKTDDTADFPKLYKETSPILDKLPDIVKGDKFISPSAKGSLIHFVFQNISYENHTRQGILDEIERMVSIELLTKEEASLLDPDLFLSFFQSTLGKRALRNLNTLNREVSFTMKYEDVYLDGQIDAFFKEADEIIMYDFKTDVTMSEDRYKNQMRYYKMALEEAYNLKVSEIYIYWTNFNKTTLINC